VCSLALCACSEVLAQDLGRVGPVYPVAEPDLVQALRARAQEHLASGQWEQEMKAFRERAKRWAMAPPGRHLPRTSEPRRRPFNASVVLPEDVRDHRGRLLYAAGTAVNPLDYRPLTTRIAFFDGTDDAQKAWARRLLAGPRRITPVLVDGPVGELMAEWGQPLFFDQHGRLVDHFGIERLPSLVYQEDAHLVIEEVPVGAAAAGPAAGEDGS